MPVPAPVPYPNIAAGPMGIPPAVGVFFMCTPAHTLALKVQTTLPSCGL